MNVLAGDSFFVGDKMLINGAWLQDGETKRVPAGHYEIEHLTERGVVVRNTGKRQPDLYLISNELFEKTITLLPRCNDQPPSPSRLLGWLFPRTEAEHDTITDATDITINTEE